MSNSATQDRAALATAGAARPHLPLAAIVVLLIAAGAFRVHLAWWKGHLGDLFWFQVWAVRDMHWTHEVPPLPVSQPNYPPLYPSLNRLLFWLHEAAHLPGDIRRPIDDSTLNESRPLLLLFKSTSMIADLVAGALLFAWGVAAARPWPGVAAAALYLFSPAILYDGAYYGQTDTILCAFVVAALFAHATRRPALLTASCVLAAAFKLQAVFVLPILGAAVALQWREVWSKHVRSIVWSTVLTAAAVVALAALTDNLATFRHGYLGVVGLYDRTTYNGLNLWWIITRPWDKDPYLGDFPSDADPILGPLTFRAIGLLAFGLALALIVWRWHRARHVPAGLLLACAAGGWAFFNLCTEMHERYSTMAAGLTCAAALWHRRWFVYGFVASLATMANIVSVCPLWYPPWPALQRTVNWLIWPEHSAAHTLVAVITVLMLPLLVEALWRAAPPHPPAATSGKHAS